ncbi:MAG: leucine--tRNA ligase [Anaerolineaceae bacterium 4572_32.2]|nr:MAG: leucine--tRNA ligase [Anaerolineaceae bacterium 4572_32.2]HEY72237.1 leucine--tRNA ligase [Thermoflexia bacterium]
MVDQYVPQEIEPKWQKRWDDDNLYRSVIDHDKPKHYALTMLPYPSGDLHIGHWYAMAPSDVRARYMRMRGYNVLFPIGFDAFGLPAENAAIHRGVHPHKWTLSNVENMRRQFRSMGTMFDWEREAVSCLPGYYRWTEWFFLKLYDMGLAYRKKSPVDFCPKCNTTLAREQVWGDDRHCERCGTPVIKKELEQWFWRITDYVDELLDFSKIDWPERVVAMQTNWIGRSEGADVTFLSEQEDPIVVFTTRPDTLWGATFMVLAPEHPLVDKLTTDEHRQEVEEYKRQAARQSEIERMSTDKEKTGVFTGAYAVNPVNGERIPIWIADYVMMTYGTGAIMAVPAHDERDFEFAEKFELPIPVVIKPPDWDGEPLAEAYTGPGPMVNSGPFSGTPGDVAVKKVTEWLEEQGTGKFAVNYRIRDWLISRQRYWGAPIPMIYCDECGIVPVPYEDLPVLLPEDAEFLPTGESPLKFHEGFLHTACPKCGGPATRETDTMDTFACSSWYNYAYLSPYYKEGEPIHADSTPIDPEELKYWAPVDVYTGGIEHATMHLIYTRFFTKAMRDMGVVDFDEPMTVLRNQGIILGEDSEKMSKSRGNVIAPDDLVKRYGADTVRAYLMFGWRWDQGGPWDSQGIEGIVRWLPRVWNLVLDTPPSSPPAGGKEGGIADLQRWTHKTIRRVTDDMEAFTFNTIIAGLMEFTNALIKAKGTPVYGTEAWEEAVETLLLLLAPCCPHIAEELWARIGRSYSVHQQSWPAFDADLAADEVITLIVQINGKLRARIEAPADITEEAAREAALSDENIRRHIGDKEIRKVIYVPGRLVNIVV